jgi:site-specific DNA recombinase
MTALQVLGYVRVSTEKQAEAGLSLDAQTAKIRAMAEVKGVPLAAVLIDAGASAKSLDRPEMTRLLALVDARTVATIIVAKLDRLTRSIRDLTDLLDRFERRGVSLVSVAESLDTRSSAGRLVIHIMGSVSQWERETIGERTRDVLQHKRANGERVGTLPFGAQLAADGVHLEAAPVEQRLLARMRTLRADGYSTRQIAADLNTHGVTTRRGTAWRFQNVAHALKVSA